MCHISSSSLLHFDSKLAIAIAINRNYGDVELVIKLHLLQKLAFLQSKFGPREVAEKWPSFQPAKSCCSAIRINRKTNKTQATSTSDLTIDKQLQVIQINN
ncbi:hypothetical protein BpHYR1_053698 [Brachionus plicatilis]|uniref:Uncharacterized protein n=1 Tax=Brachionus plicatilis TaxID=10195 RepID=A0A3M7Q083_BRAPC|nr:hypothetical protein BpHYR1_053698 [Brachionus plicatilis]